MSRKYEGDALAALRRADPLDPADAPADTSGPHATTLFHKITTIDAAYAPTRAPVTRPLYRMALAMGGAAVVAVAIIGVTVARSGDRQPEQIAGGVPIASPAMCLESYDLQTLANRDVAFDGTLASVDGDTVSFDVNTWFTGGPADQVTLDAPGLISGITSVSPTGATSSMTQAPMPKNGATAAPRRPAGRKGPARGHRCATRVSRW